MSVARYPYLSFQLHDEFIEDFAKQSPQWAFPAGAGNSFGEITFLSKYSRVLVPETNGVNAVRKERWHETCRRVVEGTMSLLKDYCKERRIAWNGQKAAVSAREMYERLYTGKWMPPGRGLWMMGTEFVHKDIGSAALQNCFNGHERFITRDGVRSFTESAGETVETLGLDGVWRKAEIKTFGMQRMQTVWFKPARTSKVRVSVEVTPEHRWILTDGSEVTDLAIGDKVPAAVTYDAYDMQAFVHGFIFGDGSQGTYTRQDGTKTFFARACSDRKRAWVEANKNLFDDVQYAPSHNGDPTVIVKTRKNLKDFPVSPTAEYARGFLAGWMLADGSGATLASSHASACEWLQENAALAGYIVTGHTLLTGDTNYGSRKSPVHRFVLRAATEWTVVEITSAPHSMAYCAVVDEEHAFTLASGIYTGNCAFLSTDKNITFWAPRLMEMSMLGIGVGFDTRGKGRRGYRGDPEKKQPFLIGDSREGWAESLRALLAHFFEGGNYPVFDYSLVRPAGAPIRRFGGTSAGPEPLARLHSQLFALLESRASETLDGKIILDSLLITDIGNLVGKAVVAANVRSSAEIVLDEGINEDFLDLKNWEVHPERNGADGWGYTSNNSVMVRSGEYDFVSSGIGDRISANGEPGVTWLDVMQTRGRLADPVDDKDSDVLGFNPCAEQPLEDLECCTLCETFPMNCEDEDDYLRTLKFAFMYAKAVTLLPTHWDDTNAVMARNRRIGTGMTGIAQYVEKFGWYSLRNLTTRGYEEIRKWDSRYSKWLGVRESNRVTTVKPSGTVALLIAKPGSVGNTPGAHWPVASGRYVRTMRLGKYEPMLEAMRTAGYKCEPNVMNPEHQEVVYLPLEGPEMRSEQEVSIWEKVSLAQFMQEHWSDNAVSFTGTFSPGEANDIGRVLNAIEGTVKAVSFLPVSDLKAPYPQMPYSKVSNEEWEELRNATRPVDFSSLYEPDDATPVAEAAGEAYCTTDMCEIKDYRLG